MRQFLNVMLHGQHAGDVEQGFPWCSAKRPCYHLYHFILDSLEHVDEAFGCSRKVPELTAVGQDR